MKKVKKFRKNQFEQPDQNNRKNRRRKASLRPPVYSNEKWSRQNFRQYLDEEE